MNSFCEAINRKVGLKIRRTRLFVVPVFAANSRIQLLEIPIMIEPHFVPGSEEIKKKIKAIARKRKIQIKEEK